MKFSIFELDDLDENIISFDINNPLLGKFDSDDYKNLIVKMFEMLIEETDLRVVSDHDKQLLSDKHEKLISRSNQEQDLLNFKGWYAVGQVFIAFVFFVTNYLDFQFRRTVFK